MIFWLKYYTYHLRRRLLWQIAKRLPASIKYFAAIFVWAHAIEGPYAGEEAPTVTVDAAIGRWERDKHLRGLI